MRRSNRVLAFMLTLFCTVSIVGCSAETPLSASRFSGLNSIADLATLRCFYHNVAEVRTDGVHLLFDTVVVGYKKAWFEYSGYVDMGVDMNKVHIDNPDANNVVRVKLPPVEVLDANLDENTFKMKSFEGGAFQKVTFEEKDTARDEAQNKMKEKAGEDRVMLTQAREHAQALIESYIVNVGESIGKVFIVEFVD